MIMDHKTAIRTKSSRAKAAQAIKAALEAEGATVTLEAAFYDPETGIRWRATVGPYSVNGEISKGSHVGSFGAHWNVAGHHAATFPHSFGWNHGVNVNQFHFSKATAFYNTLQGLCVHVGACIDEIKAHWNNLSEIERAKMDADAVANQKRYTANMRAMVAAMQVAA